MEAVYEIVQVLDGRSLIDCESYQRRYRRSRGESLEPGIYIVIQPDLDAAPQYGAGVEFIGPFASPSVARAAMEA